jgi:RNA polymerase sigma factor for flagellar operon FliA
MPHNDGLQQKRIFGGLLDSSECERLLVTSLPLVEQLCRFFCRGSRMAAEDLDDFVSEVRLHLIENDYGVLRQFEGRCSLPTFLSMTIQHLLFDYRTRLWGRFRPSQAARRLGAMGVRLETLLVRDRKPPAEAAAVLTAEGYSVTVGDVERLAAQFPTRKPRALEIGMDDVDDHDPGFAAGADGADAGVAERERLAVSRTVGDAMRAAMQDLPAEDRTILRLHFDAGMSVADIARSMALEQRPLYRRMSRICGVLRERLFAAGLAGADVTDLLGRADSNFDFGLREVRNAGAEPSTASGDKS